jgi:hypothetical protein
MADVVAQLPDVVSQLPRNSPILGDGDGDGDAFSVGRDVKGGAREAASRWREEDKDEAADFASWLFINASRCDFDVNAIRSSVCVTAFESRIGVMIETPNDIFFFPLANMHVYAHFFVFMQIQEKFFACGEEDENKKM